MGFLDAAGLGTAVYANRHRMDGGKLSNNESPCLSKVAGLYPVIFLNVLLNAAMS